MLLVGDVAYYSRFGFSAENTGALRMPGAYDPDCLLACELVPGALRGARGMIVPNYSPPSRLFRIMSVVPCGGPGIAQPA